MAKTWFITGSSRGLGLDLAKAALAAGDNVVATARSPAALADALAPWGERALAVALDVTDAAQAKAAVEAAVQKFGGIDVLVNNAGYGHLGIFEEVGMAEARQQFDTNLFGVFNVTWAALPVMRQARRGRIFNISSIGGVRGAAFSSLYVSSKFALEGFSEALAPEVAPFGIKVTIVEPGPFRTEFLSPESIRFTAALIADYAAMRDGFRAEFEARNGRQAGDPQKLAAAMLELAEADEPPLRFVAGDIAWTALDRKLGSMKAEIDRWRDLSLGTDGDYADTILASSVLR